MSANRTLARPFLAVVVAVLLVAVPGDGVLAQNAGPTTGSDSSWSLAVPSEPAPLANRVAGLTDPSLIPHASHYDFGPAAEFSNPTTFPAGTFSGSCQIRITGSSWGSWNPNTPGIHLNFCASGAANIVFDRPVGAVAVKAEPNNLATYAITMQAWDASDAAMGGFSRAIIGNGGATFLGLRTLVPEGIKRVSVVAAAGANGFAYTDLTWGYPGASGYLFVDQDRDGARDSGDPGLGGVKLRLTHGAKVAGSATSGKTGWYWFPGQVPGRYCITAELPGLKLTTPSPVCLDLASTEAVVHIGVSPVRHSYLPFLAR